MRPMLVGLMYLFSFVFAVLLAVSMRKFLFNLLQPLVYSENPSTILLNLPMNISSYLPFIIAGFFLNFVNYPETRCYIWNVIWSSIFGITIFNFLTIIWLILVGKLKLNSNFEHSSAIFSVTLPSFLIFLKS